MERKRIFKLLSLVALAGGLLAALPVAQHWPKDQTIRYVLGDGAAQLTELDVRWTPGAAGGSASGDESAREVTYRYAAGTAPRIVTHVPRLPDGDYTVDLELRTSARTATVTRKVALGGGTTSIDLGSAVPR